jgi:hypothetical protein
MLVETLGEAYPLGWRVHMRCASPGRDGLISVRECVFRCELDMETLVATRGRAFPLAPSCRAAAVPPLRQPSGRSRFRSSRWEGDRRYLARPAIGLLLSTGTRSASARSPAVLTAAARAGLAPEILKPIWRKFGVAHRVLDILVA